MSAAKRTRTRERKQSRRRREASPAALAKIRPQVAGVDLGSVEHWVCGPAVDGEEPNVRVFGTTTPQLEALASWLQEQGVESVAMESTHVYWIPLYEVAREWWTVECAAAAATPEGRHHDGAGGLRCQGGRG